MKKTILAIVFTSLLSFSNSFACDDSITVNNNFTAYEFNDDSE